MADSRSLCSFGLRGLRERLCAWLNDPTDIRIPKEYRALAKELQEEREKHV